MIASRLLGVHAHAHAQLMIPGCKRPTGSELPCGKRAGHDQAIQRHTIAAILSPLCDLMAQDRRQQGIYPMRRTSVLFRPIAGQTTTAASLVPATNRIAMAVLAATCVSAPDSFARAQDYCVTCSEPAATYRCHVEGTLSGGEGSHQFTCIKDIAQRAGHAACTVDRSAGAACAGRDWIVSEDPTAAPSPDIRAATPAPPSAQQGATAAPPAPWRSPDAPRAAQQPITKPQAAGSQPTQSPPRTGSGAADHYVPPRATPLQAMPDGQRTAPIENEADRRGAGKDADTAGTASEAAGKAGNAISGAAKKTWDCVSSLFSKC